MLDVNLTTINPFSNRPGEIAKKTIAMELRQHLCSFERMVIRADTRQDGNAFVLVPCYAGAVQFCFYRVGVLLGRIFPHFNTAGGFFLSVRESELSNAG